MQVGFDSVFIITCVRYVNPLTKLYVIFILAKYIINSTKF